MKTNRSLALKAARILRSAPLFTAVLSMLWPGQLVALDLDLVLRGSYDTSGYAQDVAVSGNYAFVVTSPGWTGSNYVGGLDVIDVSDPANPRRVGGHDTGRPAQGVSVSDNYVYVAAGDAGLQVIDVSDPVNPKQVGSYYGYAQHVAVSGNYAYVTGPITWTGSNYVGSLQVIDVSNPANPQRVGGYDTSSGLQSVAVSGNYAYVTGPSTWTGSNDVGSLEVIDVSNPANPQRVGGYETIGEAKAVAASGNYAYVAKTVCVGSFSCRFDLHLEVVDVSNPANPRRLGAYSDANSGSIQAVVGNVVGNLVFVASSDGLRVIDVSNPANPQGVGRHKSRGPASCMAVSVLGNYAYVADSHAGLQVIDVSNPANPQGVGGYDASREAQGVVVSGNYAYLTASTSFCDGCDLSGGLHLIDVSDPRNPQRVSRHDTSGYAQGVAVSGNYAYVTAFGPCLDFGCYTWLAIIDISDPRNPQRVGYYYNNYNSIYTGSVAASGNYALVFGQRWTGSHLVDSLQVIDVSNPANPQQVGGYDTHDPAWSVAGYGTPAWSVAVLGNYAYASAGNGLEVIDMSDPANPQRVGGYVGSGAGYVAVSGSYAYVVGTIDGCNEFGCSRLSNRFHVIDISNPANPQRVGGYESNGEAKGVAVSGNYAYVANGYSGLQVIDVSNPANPRRVGGNTAFEAQGVTGADGKVFVAAGDQGLIILHEYQPIRLERITRQDNGTMHLRIAGPPGVPGRVQRSPDLRTWTDWLPVNFGENPVELSDADALTGNIGFYRIAIP